MLTIQTGIQPLVLIATRRAAGLAETLEAASLALIGKPGWIVVTSDVLDVLQTFEEHKSTLGKWGTQCYFLPRPDNVTFEKPYKELVTAVLEQEALGMPWQPVIALRVTTPPRTSAQIRTALQLLTKDVDRVADSSGAVVAFWRKTIAQFGSMEGGTGKPLFIGAEEEVEA